MKKIYLEPAWKPHSLYNSLIQNPPEGYEIISNSTLDNKMFKSVSKLEQSYRILEFLDCVIPTTLVKSRLERFKRIPKETDLTYSCGHIIFRKEPWIVDTEYVSLLVSFNTSHFKQYRGIVQRALASEHCKKIMCWYETARKLISLNFPQEEIVKKLATIPLATSRKKFTKQFNSNRIKLLFVGSVNILGEFEIKGGREVLEAFILLSKKYDNLELVIRSDLPRNIKQKYQGFPNLRIIEERIPWAQLEAEFTSADIFVLPAHNTPWVVFLDAMSYELPIVTIDPWANSEIVEDGKTGLLVRYSEKILYYTENSIPTFGMPQFKEAVKTMDPKVVQGLVEKISILIENRELRRQMGKAGRWEVEQGKFSIDNRNLKLKKIFDEAIA